MLATERAKLLGLQVPAGSLAFKAAQDTYLSEAKSKGRHSDHRGEVAQRVLSEFFAFCQTQGVRRVDQIAREFAGLPASST